MNHNSAAIAKNWPLRITIQKKDNIDFAINLIEATYRRKDYRFTIMLDLQLLLFTASYQPTNPIANSGCLKQRPLSNLKASPYVLYYLPSPK